MDPRQSHEPTPGAADPGARLADMDLMGVDQAIVLPALFLEHLPVVENADVAWALARAHKDWVLDFCRADPARLYPAAVLPVQSPSFAVREAQRVAGLGFKTVAIRPSFYKGRLPNAPEYEPMWSALESLGLAVSIVPSPGGSNTEWTSEEPFVERVARHLNIGHPIAEVSAMGMDSGLFLSALCFIGHMETYLGLKLSFLHAGAYWVPVILEKSETYLWLSPQMLKQVSLEPSELFFNRPSLVNFDTWESCVYRLQDTYANVGAWGSHYPQHDASDAWEAIENLRNGGLPGDAIGPAHGRQRGPLLRNRGAATGLNGASPPAPLLRGWRGEQETGNQRLVTPGSP